MNTLAPAIARHRPARTIRIHDGLFQYLAMCDCGPLTSWSDGRRGKEAATRAITAHKRVLAAELAPELRCADPAEHHTPAWEGCPLCSAQVPLPGF